MGIGVGLGIAALTSGPGTVTRVQGLPPAVGWGAQVPAEPAGVAYPKTAYTGNMLCTSAGCEIIGKDGRPTGVCIDNGPVPCPAAMEVLQP